METVKLCPISGATMTPAFCATVLNKYSAQYFYCSATGLLQTEKPYWIDEAYRQPIADFDTGLVQRGIQNQVRLEPVVHRLIGDHARLVDVGGGYGLLCRLLRDRGFDCYSFDKYCQNVLAHGFEPPAGLRADMLFAFEVLEHIEDPKVFLEEEFDRYDCRTIVFSTLLFEEPIPSKDWWYYAFESGQHITFYQRRTLQALSHALQCSYFQLGPDLHLITDSAVGPLDLLLLRRSLLAALYRGLVHWRRRSLSRTWTDSVACKR
jgi:hypothetical protein